MDKRKLKQDWDAYTKELNKLMEITGTAATLINPSTDNDRVKKKLLKLSDLVATRANNIEKIISETPEPLDIDLPFDTETFKIAWDYYKHFLDEAHSFSMSSTVENKRLQILFRHSGKDEKKAIAILDFHICQNYKPLYKLKETQLSDEDISGGNQDNSFAIIQETPI